jgi:hypothetical protein
MHTGVGYFANTVTMGADGGPNARNGDREGALLTLDTNDFGQVPLPQADDPNLKKLEEYLAAKQPPPPPPLPQPPPPDLESKLVLGIEKSDQKSPNWLGVANPTEHLAKLSEVTQPQLDQNPGTPGVAGAGAARPPMAEPNIAPETPVKPQPQPETPAAASEHPKQDPVKPREGDPSGKDGPPETKPSRAGEPLGTGDKTADPPKGAPTPLPEPAKNDIPLPGPSEKTKGVEAVKDKPKDITDTHETIKAIEPPKAVKPVEAVPETVHAAPRPEVASPMAAVPKTSAAAKGSDAPGEAAGGGGGEHPGTKSEKEADASSTTASIEIRPGQPAAAQGLDITTRRPNFTRLTRVVASPERNPLFKVTFNYRGVVTKVKLLESSGVKDVDEPVINAIYQWTAKGKALAELTSEDPTSGLTISVRILLR